MNQRIDFTATYLPVFPVMGSLQEVIDYAEGQLPITRKNDLLAILALYQNTLLKLVAKECPYINESGVPPCR